MRGEARRLSVQIMDRESTGRRIKAARQLAHLTVPQFAARLDLPGLGAKTLGSIERGERELRPQEVEPIASALGVPTVFLVGENPAGASDPLAARLDAYGELIAKRAVDCRPKRALRIAAMPTPRRHPGRFLAPNGRTRTKPLREVPSLGAHPEDVRREAEQVASHTSHRDEPEEVGPAILGDWEEVRLLHLSQQHAKDVAQAQELRPALTIENRIRDIQRRAKQGGHDLRRETALMWRDVERANAGNRNPPARVLVRAEALEALLDGVTAKRAA